MKIPVYTDDIPYVTTEQMIEVDRAMVEDVRAESVKQAENPALIVDGLIGYRLRGAPYGTFADLIRWANAEPAPTLALDVPSGVDTTTGTIFDPAISVAYTTEKLVAICYTCYADCLWCAFFFR